MKDINLGRNSVLYLLALVIPKSISLITLPIYTNHLTPDEYAILSYTSGITAFITVLSALSLNAFYLRNYAQENDKRLLNGTIFGFTVIWNVVLLGVMLVIMPSLMRLIDAPVPFFPYMVLALVTHFFSSLEIIPMRAFRIRGDVSKYLLRSIGKAVISTVLGLWFVVECGMGILGRYYSELIVTAIFGFVYIIYMLKISTIRIDKSLLLRGLRFSLPIVPSDMLQTLEPTINAVFIERVLSMTQLGIYSIGAQIATVIHMVIQSIWLSIEPEMYIKAGKEGYLSFAKKMKDIQIVAASLFSMGCGLFVREAVQLLLSERYWDAWPIVQVLAISYIIGVLKLFYQQLVIIQGRTKTLILGNFAKIIITILLYLALLPSVGENLLGWAASAGSLAMFAVYYLAVDKSEFFNFGLRRDFVMIGISSIVLLGSRLLHSMDLIPGLLMKFTVFIFYTAILTKVYNIRIHGVFSNVIRKSNPDVEHETESRND